MPRGYPLRKQDVVTTPPDIEGAVTVETKQPNDEKAGKHLIKVKGAGTDGKVVLWEKHKDHPNGEAFVCNDGIEYIVSETKEVKLKIADGSILRVNWNS